MLTRKVPWLAFVEIHLRNGVHGEAAVHDLLGEVVADELLVCGVETEAGRQEWLSLLVLILRRHGFHDSPRLRTRIRFSNTGKLAAEKGSRRCGTVSYGLVAYCGSWS